MEKNFKDISFINDFAFALSKIKTLYELKIFLKGMFTQVELRRVAKRWQLLELLAGGMTQRKIAKKLKVSLCNITRGSREFRTDPIFKKLALRLLGEQQKRRKTRT